MTSISIKNWYTKNGSHTLFVQRRENPMLEINVIFAAGSTQDKKKLGISQLTNSMLDQGTKKFDANQIAAHFEENGAKYSESSNRDTAILSIRSLTNPKYLEPALSMFTEVLSAPNFPRSAFTRIQKFLVGAIQQQQQMPDFIARNTFLKKLYPNHPYGESVLGTLDSLQKITIHDLKEFYHQYYVAKNATITLVGDISQKKAEEIANQLTNNLAIGKAAPNIISAPIIKKSIESHIKFPSEQTHIWIGQVGIDYKDPNYFPIIVGNYILGGNPLISRLFTEVREKQGLAYSISSRISPLKSNGQFVIALQTRNNVAAKALQITRSVLDNFITQGPTAKELVAVKKKLINGFPLALATNQNIAHYLNMIGFFDLPPSYLDDYCEKINAVTAKQIKEAFQLHFPAKKMVTVLVKGTVKV